MLRYRGVTARENSWGYVIEIDLGDERLAFDLFKYDGKIDLIGGTILRPEYQGTTIGEEFFLARSVFGQPKEIGPTEVCDVGGEPWRSDQL
jgi:hypothetical protein